MVSVEDIKCGILLVVKVVPFAFLIGSLEEIDISTEAVQKIIWVLWDVLLDLHNLDCGIAVTKQFYDWLGFRRIELVSTNFTG